MNTKLSSKGQVILPKGVRDEHRWAAGTEFSVESIVDGVVLRAVKPFPPTKLMDAYGLLRAKGPAKSLKQMNEAVAREIKRRHGLGRY